MNGTLKSLLCLATAATFAITTPSFAGQPDLLPPPSPSLWHMYVAGFSGTFHGTYDYHSSWLNTVPRIVSTAAADVTQTGFIGGGEIGVTRRVTNRFTAGLAFSASGITDRASYSFTTLFSTTSVNERLKVSYVLDLSALLVTRLTTSLVWFYRIGGSMTRVRSNVRIISNDGTNQTTGTQRKTLYGLVSGFGLGYSLTQYFKTFTEFDYYYYPSVGLGNITHTPTMNTLQSRRIKLSGFVIKAGIGLAFAV